MRSIVIDTNFWLLPFEAKIDFVSQLDRLLEEPFEIIVPQAVLDELGGMARHAGRRATAARGALSAIGRNSDKTHPIVVVPEKGVADGAIITVALQKGAMVATNDYVLRRRLKERKIRTITLRDGHRVDFA